MSLTDLLDIAARSYLLDVVDVDTVRTELIDLTDALAAADVEERRMYGLFWDRLNEYDCGHISEAALRRGIASLVGETVPAGFAQLISSASVNHPRTHSALPRRTDFCVKFRPDPRAVEFHANTGDLMNRPLAER